MSRALLVNLSLLICWSGCDCGKTDLTPVAMFVRVTPEQIDFGRVMVGQAETRTVEVVNLGQTAVDGTWSLQGEGFIADDAFPSGAAVGSTQMVLRCAPQRSGTFDGELRVALTGFQPLVVPLACEGVPVPQCVASGPCRSSAWDVSAGRCVEVSQPDGQGCQASDVCLLDGMCQGGQCVGTPRDCKDGDPCTQDTCHPVRGCEHVEETSCPGEGACRVGQCVSGVGCQLVEAADGTPCGPLRGCTWADVCIAGACVQRDPPDGFECGSNGPCGGTGRCVNDVCEDNPPTLIQPSWVLQAPDKADGGPPQGWNDLIGDRSGLLTVSSYFVSPPRLGANGASPVSASQNARRCINWLGWVVCGDFPANQLSPVTALDVTTGQPVWTFTTAAQEISEFRGPSAQFFIARLAVLNESEFLALYESRPVTTDGSDTRCRNFGLVVIDRQGQGLRGRYLDDPLFSVCEHPHSYGVAVDAQSNIYLAFTPSAADNPATALTGTTFFSYSPALQFRWKRFVPALEGGELAVAQGLLFQERSPEVFSTQTGDVAAVLPAPFGLGVVGNNTAVATQAGSMVLSGFSTGSLMPAWQRNLTGTLGRAPLTIATWSSPWGAREVALAFTTQGAQVQLEATELLTGATAFSCPVALSEVPAMTAMTPGGVGVMLGTVPLRAGSPSCENCDPKYAQTSSSFAWLPLPGVAPSNAPWSGAWGDEGHSHREGR